MIPAPRLAPLVVLLGATLAGAAEGAAGKPSDAGAVGLSTAGGSGLVDVRFADGLDHRSFAFQAGAFTYSQASGTVPGDSVSVRLGDGGLQLAVGVGGWSEWWIRGRLLYHAAGTARAEWLPGDGRAGVKMFTGPRWAGLRAGLAFDLGLGLGDRERGGSTGSPDPGLVVLATWPVPLRGDDVRAFLHLNAGYRWHGDAQGRTFEGAPLYYLEPVYPAGQNDRVDLRAAFEVRAESTALFLELVLDRLRHPAVAWSESPRFLNAGFRTRLVGPVFLRMATRASIAHDDESTSRFRPAADLYPDWQWGVALGWTQRFIRD